MRPIGPIDAGDGETITAVEAWNANPTKPIRTATVTIAMDVRRDDDPGWADEIFARLKYVGLTPKVEHLPITRVHSPIWDGWNRNPSPDGITINHVDLRIDKPEGKQ